MTRPTPPEPPTGGDAGPGGPEAERARGRRDSSARGSLASRLSGLPRGERRSPRAVAVAVAAHLVLGALFVRAYTFENGMPAWLDFGGREKTVQERITYVSPRVEPDVPTRTTPPVTRPQVTRPSTIAPLAPAGEAGAPPAALPPAAPRDTGGGAPRDAGNGIGALDPNLRGVRPGYNDERVWRGPVGAGGSGGGTGVATGDRADKLDSIMAGMLTAARDSLDSLNRAQGRGQYRRAPGDWTRTDKNGNKWGWDQQGIKLGKVTIPNALLGLLPMNAATAAQMSGNPIAMGREARLNAARADIQRMSERGMGEAEFKRVLKEMESRRDTQRRERLRAPSANIAAPVNKASDK